MRGPFDSILDPTQFLLLCWVQPELILLRRWLMELVTVFVADFFDRTPLMAKQVELEITFGAEALKLQLPLLQVLNRYGFVVSTFATDHPIPVKYLAQQRVLRLDLDSILAQLMPPLKIHGLVVDPATLRLTLGA